MSPLEKLQKRIDGLGIRDIKLFRAGPVDEVSLIEILTSHLNGESTKMGLIGDSNYRSTFIEDNKERLSALCNRLDKVNKR